MVMCSRLNLPADLLIWILVICAFLVEDIDAGTIRRSNSSSGLLGSVKPQKLVIPTTLNRPKTPPAPSTPKRPKTPSAPPTPKRPKTPPIPSTPKRRQTLPVPSTTKRLHSNHSFSNNSQPLPSSPKPATPTDASVCEDYHVECRRWAIFGYCYNGYVRNYMRKTCKKSCKFCGHMVGRCRDNHFYCPSWTWRGGCERNVAFMTLNCRRSCQAC